MTKCKIEVFSASIGFLSKLTFLTLLRPYLLGAAFLMLSYSFWKLYLKNKKPDCPCPEDLRARTIARIAVSVLALLLIGTYGEAAVQQIVMEIKGMTCNL